MFGSVVAEFGFGVLPMAVGEESCTDSIYFNVLVAWYF